MQLIAVLIVLGVVQGIAEFLPISSSGHLVILEQIPYVKSVIDGAGKDLNLLINVSLHVATLIAVILFLRDEISTIIKGLWQSITTREWYSANVRKTVYILVATLPAGLAGILFKDTLEHVFASSTTAFVMLILNGILLISTKMIPVKNRQLEETGIIRSLVVGCFQALAIMPGISRSGMTIAGGLMIGLAPAQAAIFSFLMSVPVIAGAGILEGRKLVDGAYPGEMVIPLLISMVITIVVAYFSIKLLFEMVKKVKLDIFGYYTIALGTAGLIITAILR